MKGIRQRVENFKADRVHGASQLLAMALNILKDAAMALPGNQNTIIDQLESLAVEMAGARPGMVNIKNVMKWFRMSLSLLDASEGEEPLRLKAAGMAGLFSEYCGEKSRLLIANAVRSIPNGGTLMTCSFSSTVLRTLQEANRLGTCFSVRVLESCWEDCRYGAAMHQELEKSGIISRLIKDTEATNYLPGTDLVLLGADTLFYDGTLINGFPSRELAAAAASSQPSVPVIALLESIKISRQTLAGRLQKGFQSVPDCRQKHHRPRICSRWSQSRWRVAGLLDSSAQPTCTPQLQEHSTPCSSLPPLALSTDGFQAVPFACLFGIVTEKGLHHSLDEIRDLIKSTGLKEFLNMAKYGEE